jgi:hypothetical protein
MKTTETNSKTAVYAGGRDLTCRVYEPYGKKRNAVLNCHGKTISPRIRDVAGNPTEGLRPWPIANLVVREG